MVRGLSYVDHADIDYPGTVFSCSKVGPDAFLISLGGRWHSAVEDRNRIHRDVGPGYRRDHRIVAQPPLRPGPRALSHKSDVVALVVCPPVLDHGGGHVGGSLDWHGDGDHARKLGWGQLNISRKSVVRRDLLGKAASNQVSP